MNDINPLTKGSHHIGLTVSKLEESARFFIDLLGWPEIRRDPDYPAIFVSDGVLMITLWGIQSNHPIEFNKSDNIGLHHLALSVKDFDTLDTVYNKLKNHDVRIEFICVPK